MATLIPERSVVASLGAGSVTAALTPFTNDLCNRLATYSDTWASPFWHGILRPMASETFQGFVVVIVMAIVAHVVADRPKLAPADSRDSGDANAMTPAPKGD